MTKAVDILANPGVRAAQRAADVNNGVGVDDIVLSGKRLEADISDAIISGEIEMTIEGASTVTFTVHDPHRRLIESGILKSSGKLPVLDMELDTIIYRLVQISKQGDDFTLTFEDRDVEYLRRHKKARKASRGKVTRAEFARVLVNEVKASKIKFFCPELHKKQPLASSGKTSKEKDDNKESGFSDNADIEVKREKATKGQIRNIEDVLDTGVSMDAPRKLLIASVMVITQESVAKSGNASPGHVGLFNQDPRYWPATGNAVKDARGFFKKAIDVYKDQPGIGYAELAEKVQGAGLGTGPYDQWRGEAIATVSAYEGDGTVLSDSSKRKYEFKRNNGEDSWTCLGRLAEEVGWRRFMIAGTLYFISEEDLFKSRPRITISEGEPGVDWIDYDIDSGKKVSEVTIHGRMERWAAPQGTVVEINDSGPADGRWLVASVRPSLFSNDIEISCRKPIAEKGEPTASEGSGGGGSGAGSGNKAVNAAYDEAKAIHAKHYQYQWGGGHNSAFRGPYDCSGAVSAVLHAAGLLDSPRDSSGLASWGTAGKGKEMTVYANATHAFIEFEVDGKTVHFGTGDWGKGWSGAGINPKLHPHNGFQARHSGGT